MSTFFEPKGSELMVRCESCKEPYPWGLNRRCTPYTIGEGTALQHRDAYEVRCPWCSCIEAKWSLATRSTTS